MHDWIDHLLAVLARGETAVLVTVADTHGSVPRESGCHMVVGEHALWGSIGGGKLEHLACAVAHELRQAAEARTQVVRIPLGARAGQCCGGVVWLTFERIDQAALAWLQQAAACARSTARWGRWVALGTTPDAVRIWQARGSGARPLPLDGDSDTPLPIAATDRACELLQACHGAACGARLNDPRALDGPNWLLEVAARPRARIQVFGAGHVGSALVEVLARLPFVVRWIDEREEVSLPAFSDAVEICRTDSAVAEVDRAADDDLFLVLTHSHALDFDLVRAILSRRDFGFLGLIGSHAKRANFADRLAARGLPHDRIARMQCPIGVPEVGGKEPTVIAIAVAAQLLALSGETLAGLPERRTNRDNRSIAVS